MEEEEEPLHRKRELVDEGSGTRVSVLRLSTGAAEGQLADVDVTSKCSQTDPADKQILDSELLEVRHASKPPPSELSESETESYQIYDHNLISLIFQ